MRRLRTLSIALALAGAVTLGGCREQTTEPGLRYVGSDACTSCHADVAAVWRVSPHHLAMLPAKPDAPLRASRPEGGPLVEHDGNLLMTAKALGAAENVPLSYSLGIEHVEQYLGALTPGRLQALPIAFDVQRKDWFDLFAHEQRTPADWGHWTNRGMNANAQCLFCHTTNYDKGYQQATDTYDSTWGEIGVGCEACHGPGSEHVRVRTDGRGEDPWAVADPDALLGNCGSCHSRRIERAPWVPNHPFLDAFEPEILDTNAYYADGQVREELYELVSFQMSRMHAEGVRCWNCHDPHSRGTRAEGNALCRTCHDASYEAETHTHHAADSAGAQCVGCHMPITVYMEHDPRRDHSFSRPDPQATIDLGIPNACNRCHTERDPAWAAEHMRSWYPKDAVRAARRATAATIAGARQGNADTVPGLLELIAGDADAVRRASGARLLQRFPTSSGVTPALVTALRDQEPLVRAGAAWALSQRPVLAPEVRTGLEGALSDPIRIVRLHAALGLRDVDPRSLPAATAQALTTAAAEWRESQLLVADTPEAHYNLAIFLAARHDVAGAEREYREALRLWPGSIQAQHNLALLLAQNGQLDAAEKELRALVERDPVPDSAFALGLLYGQQGRWNDAAQALERCLAENPTFPRARYNLALAYAKAGDTKRALDELERATEDPTTRREAILTLVDVARQVKDRARVERWVLEAAKLDPSVAENPDMRALVGE